MSYGTAIAIVLGVVVLAKGKRRRISVGFATEHDHSVTAGGRFYTVRAADTHGSVAAGVLQAAALTAGATAAEAEALAADPALRSAYLDLLFCSPENDDCYGTFGAAPSDHVGPHGRTIRFRKAYPDNAKRLDAGLPAIRNIEQGERGRKARTLDPVFATDYPCVWLVPIDGVVLLHRRIVTCGLVQHHDGANPLCWPPGHPGVVSVDDVTRGAHGR